MMKNFKKSVVKSWKVLVRFFLLVATVAAMLFVTVNVGKVFVTQVRLVSMYKSIESAESKRDAYARDAQMYENVYARKAYQSQADSYDAEAKLQTEKRNNLMHNSSDPIVAWAAKNGFEHSIFWPSLIAMLALLVAWYKGFQNLTQVIGVEETVFNFIVYVVFIGASMVMVFLGRCCYCVAKIHKKKPKKHHKKASTHSNVVAFDKKRRLGWKAKPLFYITNNKSPTVAKGTVKLSVPFIEIASIIVTITEIIAALKYQYGTFT